MVCKLALWRNQKKMEAQLQRLSLNRGRDSQAGKLRQQQYQQQANHTNVQMPVAYASRAATVAAAGAGPRQRPQTKPPSTTVPAIPRSQAVKQLMEPSYSMILQPEVGTGPPVALSSLPKEHLQQQQQQPIYANTTNSVYSYYSELEALRCQFGKM